MIMRTVLSLFYLLLWTSTDESIYSCSNNFHSPLLLVVIKMFNTVIMQMSANNHVSFKRTSQITGVHVINLNAVQFQDFHSMS